MGGEILHVAGWKVIMEGSFRRIVEQKGTNAATCICLFAEQGCAALSRWRPTWRPTAHRSDSAVSYLSGARSPELKALLRPSRLLKKAIAAAREA